MYRYLSTFVEGVESDSIRWEPRSILNRVGEGTPSGIERVSNCRVKEKWSHLQFKRMIEAVRGECGRSSGVIPHRPSLLLHTPHPSEEEYQVGTHVHNGQPSSLQSLVIPNLPLLTCGVVRVRVRPTLYFGTTYLRRTGDDQKWEVVRSITWSIRYYVCGN